MPTTIKPYRYQLPKKAIKIDCPHCGGRKTWSRYVDTRTGEPLPESFGICDRASNCGQHLSPYHKQASGLSYADEVYLQWKEDNPITPRISTPKKQEPKPIPAVYSIPDGVYRQSLKHYGQNIFVQLLCERFGETVVNEVLKRFAIGTSSHWPGATVFWYVDEQGRKRGGQIKLFNPDWHTAKYKDRDGKARSKTTWVHYALIKKASKAGVSLPDWLQEYNQKAECCPCMFGLPQLSTAPFNQPIAVVESPKTAILCSVLMPDFIWLAVGSLSNLTTGTDSGLSRLAPLRGRTIQFYPDLSIGGTAFQRWSKVAAELNKQGYSITVSDLLETLATDEQRQAGFDLADFLLASETEPAPEPVPAQVAPEPEPTPQVVTALADWKPGTILRPDELQIERLTVEPCEPYPVSWDEPPAPDAVPTLRPLSFHEWQQQHPYFSQMGLASINRP